MIALLGGEQSDGHVDVGRNSSLNLGLFSAEETLLLLDDLVGCTCHRHAIHRTVRRLRLRLNVLLLAPLAKAASRTRRCRWQAVEKRK
jgi:hypothetical protein